jgi:hypothetical protein
MQPDCRSFCGDLGSIRERGGAACSGCAGGTRGAHGTEAEAGAADAAGARRLEARLGRPFAAPSGRDVIPSAPGEAS